MFSLWKLIDDVHGVQIYSEYILYWIRFHTKSMTLLVRVLANLISFLLIFSELRMSKKWIWIIYMMVLHLVWWSRLQNGSKVKYWNNRKNQVDGYSLNDRQLYCSSFIACWSRWWLCDGDWDDNDPHAILFLSCFFHWLACCLFLG